MQLFAFSGVLVKGVCARTHNSGRAGIEFTKEGQRVLIIRGKVITNSETRQFNRAFGLCYNRGEKLAQFIDYVIEDNDYCYPFSSFNEFWRFVSHSLHGRYEPLRLLNLHPNINFPVKITMTGSYKDDCAAANANANNNANNGIRIEHTPDGYTWHHAENIWQEYGAYCCNMYLIRTDYHRPFTHVGGVHEYEIFTGRKYRR